MHQFLFPFVSSTVSGALLFPITRSLYHIRKSFSSHFLVAHRLWDKSRIFSLNVLFDHQNFLVHVLTLLSCLYIQSNYIRSLIPYQDFQMNPVRMRVERLMRNLLLPRTPFCCYCTCLVSGYHNMVGIPPMVVYGDGIHSKTVLPTGARHLCPIRTPKCDPHNTGCKSRV